MDSNDRILRRNCHFLRQQFTPTEAPPAQPVPPMSSARNRPDDNEEKSLPEKRSYAEVAAEPTRKEPTPRTERPKREIKKPVRFSDKNFVYGEKQNKKK